MSPEHRPTEEKPGPFDALQRFAAKLFERPSGVLRLVLGVPIEVAPAAPESRVAAFDGLRTSTLAGMRGEYDQRMAASPTPTAQELSLGLYAQNLEPQVRDAVFALRDKGYDTSASGFFGTDNTWRIIGIEGEDVPRGTYEPTADPANRSAQIMDFSQGFELAEGVVAQLAEAGAEVVRHPSDGLIHRIGFMPDTPDLNAITANWNTIASVLPDTGTPALPAPTFNPGFTDWGGGVAAPPPPPLPPPAAPAGG